MIIETLLLVLYEVLDVLLVFKIPPLPDGVTSSIEYVFQYIESGASILANYTPLGYLLSLFSLLITIELAINIYNFVMWLIKKIPMLNIK